MSVNKASGALVTGEEDGCTDYKAMCKPSPGNIPAASVHVRITVLQFVKAAGIVSAPELHESAEQGGLAGTSLELHRHLSMAVFCLARDRPRMQEETRDLHALSPIVLRPPTLMNQTRRWDIISLRSFENLLAEIADLLSSEQLIS
nr:hypothetical protein CFP56_42248 [Quercus suber]